MWFLLYNDGMSEQPDNSESGDAFNGRQLANSLLSELGQAGGADVDQEPTPEEQEKSAQLKKAERFYFGKRKLAQMLEFVADPSLQDADLKAGILSIIQQEFGIEDETDVAELESRLEGALSLRDKAVLAGITSDFLMEYGNVGDYEVLLRQRFNESQGFTPLNETFSFHADADTAFLHIAPSRTLAQAERAQQLMSGLASLATQLANDPELASIDSVKMISLLLTSYRSAIEQLGFEVQPVEDEAILAAFSVSKGSLLEAVMSKTTLLHRYTDEAPNQTVT